MNAFAIVLDLRPEYIGSAGGSTSLLLAPLGMATVLRHLSDRLSLVGHSKVTIAAAFEPEADYRRLIGDAGVPLEAIVSARELAGRIADYEPSDWLVIVDPRCVPSKGFTRGALELESGGGPRRVRHLVVLEAHSGGTTERVQLGANGTVGRIQRYYDAATWPFTAGVACSIVPVSCTIGASDLPFTSLRDLRRGLAERGVPSSDVFIPGGALDLSQESDLLRLSERVVLDHFSGRRPVAWPEVGLGCRVDPTARLIGPVVLHDGAVIGPDAIVVGPAVIGERARVEREAMVAQCVVGPDSVVGRGVTLRHRAAFGAVNEPGPSATPVPADESAPAPIVEPSDVQDEGPRSSGAYPLLKAAFDVTASAVGLLVLGPLFLLIALFIKLESKGPVLYRDRREGKGGRVFECLKFRTMCAGADAQQRDLLASHQNEVDGPQFKLARDPRVTRLGRVLRTLNLDELPQLINVLRLEMSLVGPRPSPFRENQLCIPWRAGRLSVRPGITGLWQVCRNRRAQGDFHQWIHFDLLYVRHMSFLVDLKILAATVVTLAAQWPIPSSWIVPPRDLDAGPQAPVFVKVKTASATAAGPSGSPAGLHVSAN